jgi:hypothetical protein
MCLEIHVNYGCGCQYIYIPTKCEDIIAMERAIANGIKPPTDEYIELLFYSCTISNRKRFSGRTHKCTGRFVAMHR